MSPLPLASPPADRENISPPAAYQTAAQNASPERVSMATQELGLYVQGNCPTGLLLRSTAALKGLTVAGIAAAAGLPADVVRSLLSNRPPSNAMLPGISAIANVLGVNLTTLKLVPGRVHVFRLGCLKRAPRSREGRVAMRAVGLLARGAKLAELRVGRRVIDQVWWSGRVHVAQTDTFRALFVGTLLRRFDPSWFPSGEWACGQRKASILGIEDPDLLSLLLRGEVTEAEFDELFQGVNPVNWADVQVASRINGVSKTELMGFIQSRASAQAEQTGVAAGCEREAGGRGAVKESRAALAVVRGTGRLVAQNEAT